MRDELRDALFLAPPLLLDLAAAGLALDLDALELLFDLAVELFADERPELLLLFRVPARLEAAPPDELRRALPALLPRPLEREPLSSAGHLPLITRCAASLTASAMREPSRVALWTTLFAAFSVVSAASIPASLIALRALGLALMAAAAAASPAASISLLIAALAIFSDVDLDEAADFGELVRLVDFAIACLLAARLDTQALQRFRCGCEKALPVGRASLRGGRRACPWDGQV